MKFFLFGSLFAGSVIALLSQSALSLTSEKGLRQYDPAPAENSNYIYPVQGVISSGYGWHWGRMHTGIDIVGAIGTPIVAAAPGVVIYSGWKNNGYGNLVEIQHADRSITRYAHNNRILVRQGQQVTQGQLIAEMGTTGYSTGPHCHFELILPTQGAVNPASYLAAMNSSGTASNQ